MNAERTRAPGPGVVAGVFGDEQAAVRAVSRLADARFDAPGELQVINAHRREHEEVPVAESFPIGRNALVGGVIGAVLGFVGVGLVVVGWLPDPGLFSPWPLLAVFQGFYLGAVAGFGLGAVSGIGHVRSVIRPARAHVHGVNWVGVQAEGERAEEARAILREAGAKHFMA